MATGIRRQSLKEFRKEQIKILKDFCISLTPEQRRHIESLQSEIAIENYKRTLLGIEEDSSTNNITKGKNSKRLWR